MKDKLKCFKTLTGSILSLALVLGAVPFMGTEVKADEVVNEYGFEGGLEGWISIDADGDGYEWHSFLDDEENARYPHQFRHGGDDALISESYLNSSNTSLDPDNWLISPKVQLGGSISFYANSIDHNYPDHIGVFVTTGERDDLDSYTLVEDWWILEGWSTGSDDDPEDNWGHYTVSLEAFEGTGYVAIRHYDSSDQFIVAVDDVVISGGAMDEIEADVTGFEGACDGKQHGITVDVTGIASYEISYGTEEGDYSLGYSPQFVVPGTYTVYYKITAEGYYPLTGSETVVIEAPAGMIYQDFDGDCEGWTLIDNDEDEEGWFLTSVDYERMLGSISWSSDLGAREPDNWFISPAVELGGSISFYGTSLSRSWPEHIGVFVTTGDIDDLDSYELIADFVVPAEWTYYTFDLSDYSGEGYIAIRHYESSDNSTVYIDNLVIFPEQASPEGWIQEGDLWFYFEDGEAVTGWKQIDGVWYFFGEDGSMTKGWYQEGSSWYYFKSSGAMAKGWTKVGNNWYYFTSGGKMKTGWLQDGSKWYYLKSSGAMATGWTKVSGKWYFMGTDGVMKTGWVQDAGKWYYMDSNGTMHTGWLQIGAKWYYLNSSGVMVTGTQTINGKTYTFNSSGVWIK